jgi:hypothetical protein
MARRTETRVVATRWDERSEPEVLDVDAGPDAPAAEAPDRESPRERAAADAIQRINDVVAQITANAARDRR